MNRVNISMSLSGTIALADFLKIAALVDPDNASVSINQTDEPATKPVGASVIETGNSASSASTGAAPSTEALTAVEAPIGVDAGGHPWSADLHASTGSKTKEGYWRMKVGVTRPADLPGYPKVDAATGAGPSVETVAAVNGSATGAPAISTVADEEDEFAAFAKAANAGAAVEVKARTWSDADLAKLANQAAQKLGSPDKVKEQIAIFTPAGVVAHSRNIPADKREEFAVAVEAVAGIEFAG